MGLLELPAGSIILDWPPANYVNPVTRGWSGAACCLILAIAALLVLGARISSRLQTRTFGTDDSIMIIAMVPTLALVINMYLALRVYHFDRHLWDINSDYSVMLKLAFANEFLYILAAGLVKLAVLVYYQRFTLTGTSRPYGWAVWFSIAFVAGHVVAFGIESFVNCRPFDTTFEVDMVNTVYSTCANTRTIANIRGLFTVVEDFAVVFLGGWLAVCSTATKTQTMLVISIGLIVCLVGLVRLNYLWTVYAKNSDWSWYGGIAFMWSAIECLGGMLAGSFPAIMLTTNNEEWKAAPMSGVNRATSVGDILRKFSMNESGRQKYMQQVNVKEADTSSVTSHTGTKTNKNAYGRRRSRMASVAGVIPEQ